MLTFASDKIVNNVKVTNMNMHSSPGSIGIIMILVHIANPSEAVESYKQKEQMIKPNAKKACTVPSNQRDLFVSGTKIHPRH